MKRSGFSMIELVFIIVIMGILAAVAVPKMMMSRDDACYAKLRANLSEAQGEITREYTRRFMKGQGLSITDADFIKILQNSLGADASAKCGFTITNAGAITMIVGKNTMTLKAEQKDGVTKSPSIECNDTTNEMCKKLMGKK